MRRVRPFGALALVVCFGLTAAACGDDGGGDESGNGGSGGGGSTPARGTCDLRELSSSCIELLAASAVDLENQEDGCVDRGGDWSNEPCPTTDALVGCCDYEFGNSFHECFYEGITRDPVAYCAMMDGLWIPAA